MYNHVFDFMNEMKSFTNISSVFVKNTQYNKQ